MNVVAFLGGRAWIWSFIATALVWLATVAFTGGTGGGQILTAALSFAIFTVIVGIGQMFVITTGPGNVDLSIPATMALSGAVTTKLMDTQNEMIALGVVVALGIGIGVGLGNYLLIRLLRIPPIIATLSASFLVQSTAIAYGRGLRIKPPPLLADFTTAQVAGVPVLAACGIVFTVVMGVVLARTLYGRSVLAVGQNMRAAWLAGINVERTRLFTYVLSAMLAGLAGLLLSGFSGGSSLNMGEEYLLASIAVVVIGGTSVAGGRANVPGIWGAALFLYLLVTMLNTFGASAGLRLILTGLIIIAVITLAGGGEQQKR
ncbi:monosaccharide ABC transporter membrane protein (CUT2 family) [Dongia mobilis]|uniref:Autoinducer 2 import system permease protein LsrD n=1 Tax=Dongia mobilis TaxID=578943 RepID=A0A4R6WJA5_9PROT|nr:ABC transporter permease [Dongia mobilis]TDQ80472.1 monosaccharide ABC transporter membrane protein (CUT2 family) [Dongia mobilis]